MTIYFAISFTRNKSSGMQVSNVGRDAIPPHEGYLDEIL